VYLAYKRKCFFTGRPVAREEMVIDHLIPVSKNGKDCFENYVLTFKDLNIGKSNKIDENQIDGMKYIVELVYAPRAKKIYEKLAGEDIEEAKHAKEKLNWINKHKEDLGL